MIEHDDAGLGGEHAREQPVGQNDGGRQKKESVEAVKRVGDDRLAEVLVGHGADDDVVTFECAVHGFDPDFGIEGEGGGAEKIR